MRTRRTSGWPVGDASGASAQLFVGQYEARATPIADTDPGTALDDVFTLVPGTYELVARANGFGHVRTTLTVRAGQLRDFAVNMPLNLASTANGATATGDGVNLGALIDDTEMTNWASLGSPIAGKQVTVRLDPSRRAHTFDRIQVSAMLRHRIPTARTTAARRAGSRRCGSSSCCVETAGRSTALRRRSSRRCTRATGRVPGRDPAAAGARTDRARVQRAEQARDARTAPSADQPVHGQPGYQGDQDDDPTPGHNTDCDEGSTQDDNVRAAELQVFR